MPYSDGSSKKIRADSYTKYFLELIHEHAETDDLKSAVKDIIDHVGYTRYRAGGRLLDLIAFAAREAAAINDSATVSRLDDLEGHATGRVLSEDLARKYQLFNDARETNISAVELYLPNAYHLALAQVEEFLADHPNSSRADVVDHLRDLSELSIKVTERVENGGTIVYYASTPSVRFGWPM